MVPSWLAASSDWVVPSWLAASSDWVVPSWLAALLVAPLLAWAAWLAGWPSLACAFLGWASLELASSMEHERAVEDVEQAGSESDPALAGEDQVGIEWAE